MAQRQRHAAAFKALEALTGARTVVALAAWFEVHPTLLHQGSWEDRETIQWIVFPTNALLEGALGAFERGVASKAPEVDPETVRDLHAKIGALAVANDAPRGLRGPTGATVLAAMSRKLKPWGGTW